jgi:hypothetical protein
MTEREGVLHRRKEGKQNEKERERRMTASPLMMSYAHMMSDDFTPSQSRRLWGFC